MRKCILDFPAYFIGRNLLVLLLMLVSTSIALAQITVTGKVTGEDGESLPGASILEEGTSNGTISDANGDYTLSVS
ncbi:MAG: carboxypeptidase-like regulatory domain-containing protein, partial [Cyclobacteriaceae bacterium]